MRAVTAPCAHLLRTGPGPAPFREREILDDYDGMTVGIVECSECGATCVFDLLDWDGHLERRIFHVAAIAPEIVVAFETRAGRATCKLEQARLEIEALLSQRAATSALVAYEIHDKRVLAVAALEAGESIPSERWADALPPAGDARWFERLGLEKGALD